MHSLFSTIYHKYIMKTLIGFCAVFIIILSTLQNNALAQTVPCPDQDGTIDTHYCDCDNDAYAGIFVCASTSIPNVYDASECSGNAGHPIYIIIRSKDYCGNIDSIIVHVHKYSSSTKFALAAPLKNWGATNTPPLPSWNVPWDMKFQATITGVAALQCFDWGSDPHVVNQEVAITCTPHATTQTPDYLIYPCDERTIAVYGGGSVWLDVYYTDTHTATFSPNVSGTL
jgi:hypothetical protein